MAKPFGKSCSDWLRTEHSKRMINAISTSKKCDVADLVRVMKGGNNLGTWMHEDVAIEFGESRKVENAVNKVFLIRVLPLLLFTKMGR